MTIIWLKIVYARYETTTGLPVEYGTVHVSSVLGGIICTRRLHLSLTLPLSLSPPPPPPTPDMSLSSRPAQPCTLSLRPIPNPNANPNPLVLPGIAAQSTKSIWR